MRGLALLSLTCVGLMPSCKATTSPSAAAVNPTGSPTLSDKCDASKLADLTGALATAEPEAGPELVANKLGKACELPPVVTSFLAESPAPAGDSSLGRGVGGGTPQAHEALTAICPTATAIKKHLLAIPGAQRDAALYDLCDFQRFGLMDRESWINGRPSSATPFFAYDWFTEQGIAEADAKALATAMLLRDRAAWAVDDQTLPTTTQALGAVPDGVTVHVTRTSITVGGQRLVSMLDGAVDPSALQGHLIGPLFDVLAEEAEQRKVMAEKTGGEAWLGTAVVVADADVPQRTLVDILYTAGRAEFRRYALVAQSAPFESGAVLIYPPKFRVKPQPEAEKAREVVVHVAKDGFSVAPATSEGLTAKIPLSRGSGHDFAALTSAVQAHKKANPTATIARVDADDSTSFAVLVQTLATLQGADCHTSKRACLLPELIIQAGQSTLDPRAQARKAGILGTLKEGHFVATPRRDEDVWGGLTDAEVGEAFGVGGLGIVGTGRGGADDGSEEGRDSPSRGKSVPRVRQAKASTTGKLDKDIIRRIVRAHINEVRYCYNKGLVKDPKLAGRVSIDFAIGATGKVTSSSVDNNTLADANVGQCIAKAVKRWKFPKPTDGGTVTVTYPFVLEPG